MRSKSQQLMNEISAYVDQYYSERHSAPSVNEIAKGVGIAKTTSYRYLVAMNDLGMLRYDGASRTITTRMISKFSESTVPAPVVGAIPCGTPEEEEENIQEYVSLPVSLFGKGEFYILKATGDSMVDAGIEDGDMVVIRKQPEAMIGDIVVEVFERYLSNACPDDLTIEHVFQDADSSENGKIGNLLPLEARLNEKCQGKDFAGKLDVYSESNFRTTRNFANRYKKQDFRIDSRTDVLGKTMYREILKFNPV